MSWAEVEQARKENRHELVLSGAEISDRIHKGCGLDPGIFAASSLNYLNIHNTCLDRLPDAISLLANLQTLVLHSNRLATVPRSIGQLEKLKVLDLSNNQLEEMALDFEQLPNLATINASSNRLAVFKVSPLNSKLQVLDLANNRLQGFPLVCHQELVSFTDLRLCGNEIGEIPTEIRHLSALKNLDLSNNRLKTLPGELTECNKLKDVNLKENPISDRRLSKLIDQCRTKQILDYVRQHCPKTSSSSSSTSTQEAKKKGGGKSKRAFKNSESNGGGNEDDDALKLRIVVRHCTDASLRIVVGEEVRTVRPFIVACLVLDFQLSEDTFKRFIQLQTRLHETLCERRNAATIATHDLAKIPSGNLVYTAKDPKQLKIRPLNRPAGTLMSAAEMYGRLQEEAEALRKEKKRNVYSGLHKYLYLLEGQKQYPCLLAAADNQVISFPPITNSDVTKIGPETTSMFVEVTSSRNMQICKTILDVVLKETALLLNQDLLVQQVKNTDAEGNLKSVYPSKTDLQFAQDAAVVTVREN